MKALEACDISFSYGATQILSGVNLSVEYGEVVGLLGPNGTGKSTLLAILAGDLPSRTGEITVRGKQISDYSLQELAQIRAVMPQTSEFPFSYISHDVVLMGRACWGTSREENEDIVAEAMKMTQSSVLKDREITQLSGGEVARVTLSRVIAQQASIIFLDEPTASLDIAHQERTMQLCRDLAQSGRAVVAVMHDIQLSAAYCDRIALINAGSIVSIGSPRSVLTSQSLSEVYDWPINVHHFESGELAILPSRVL